MPPMPSVLTVIWGPARCVMVCVCVYAGVPPLPSLSFPLPLRGRRTWEMKGMDSSRVRACTGVTSSSDAATRADQALNSARESVSTTQGQHATTLATRGVSFTSATCSACQRAGRHAGPVAPARRGGGGERGHADLAEVVALAVRAQMYALALGPERDEGDFPLDHDEEGVPEPALLHDCATRVEAGRGGGGAVSAVCAGRRQHAAQGRPTFAR